MNILIVIFCLICSASGGIILPFAREIVFSDPEDTYPILDVGKFFSFLGAVLPNETSPEPSSTPSPPEATPESTDPTITSSEAVLLVPLSETIFVPEYMIPSLYASSNAYLNPPTDTQLPSNLELAEITDIRAVPIAEYVQNYPLANNLQHDPITEEQMLLTQLYDMDFVNKTEIKPATSINNFHVNEQRRLQRSQQPTESEYQQPFQNINLSSNSSTNINETDSSVEKHILANKTGSHGESGESADVETAYAKDFGVFLNGVAYNFFEKANSTVVKEFLDENGKPCVAEQLQFYSKSYFRYTCEGDLFQVSSISTTAKSDAAPFDEDAGASALPSSDEILSAAQVNSSALPADLHHFHSFYLKRKVN